MRFLDKLQPLGLLAMRIALGAVMIVHGYPKVTGIHNVEKFFSSIGLPWWSAYLSAGAEFFGGILIIIGLLASPIASRHGHPSDIGLPAGNAVQRAHGGES